MILLIRLSVLIVTILQVKSQSFCPPLPKPADEGKEIQCQYNGEATNCYTYSVPGTTATFKCNKFYRTVQRNRYTPSRAICDGSTGKWKGSTGSDVFCSIECGKTVLNRQKYIIGGSSTNFLFWPWYAGIYFETNGVFEFKCGGTLISLNTILTAAHCAKDVDNAKMRVILGSASSDFYDIKAQANAQIFSVKRSVIHKDYDPSTVYSDIALLFLTSEVTLTDYVSPVCLPEDRRSNILLSDFDNSVGEVVGFGFFDESQKASKNMKYVSLQLRSPTMCRDALDATLSSTQFCAGNSRGDTVCKGDSGSGMVFKDTSAESGDQYFIQGIVSFGDSRKLAEYGYCQNVAVFTKVLAFIRWIEYKTVNEEIASFAPTPYPTSTAKSSYTSTTATTTRRPTISNHKPILELALTLHNQLRRYHAAPPMQLSNELTREAQAWSDQIVYSNLPLKLKTNTKNGQNAFEFKITGGTISEEEIMRKAMDSWYAKKAQYNPSNPISSSFSQLVWKSSLQLGIGITTKNGRTIVVGFYSPAGNLVGSNGQSFRENVKP